MTTEPKRADITKDRIFAVVGASLTHFYDMMLPLDSAPVMMHLVPIVDEATLTQEPVRYPRDKDIGIGHEVMVGTVDEIVEDFRKKLTKAFNIYTLQTEEYLDGPPLVIPCTGTTDLEPQNEAFARHGLTQFTVLKPVSKEVLQVREDFRNKLDKNESPQNPYVVSFIRRCYHAWHGLVGQHDIPESESSLRAAMDLYATRHPEPFNIHRIKPTEQPPC